MNDTVRRDYIPFTQVPNDLITSIGLSASAKVVYMTVSMHANNMTRSAFPGINRIAYESGMSRNTVIKAIKELETQGWLEVTRERTPKGDNEVNHYHVKNCIGSANSILPGSAKNALGGSANSAPELDSSSELDSSLKLVNSVQSHDPIPENRDTLPFGSDFDEVWKEYPRKNGRTAAHKAYAARRRGGVAAEELLLATKNFRKAMNGREQQYIKQGSTFFGPSLCYQDYVTGVPDDSAVHVEYSDEEGAWEKFERLYGRG